MCRIARQNDPSRHPTSSPKAMEVVGSDANDVNSGEIDERADLLADEGWVGRLLDALSIRYHQFPSVVGTRQGNVCAGLTWIADLCMVRWQALVFFSSTSSCVDDDHCSSKLAESSAMPADLRTKLRPPSDPTRNFASTRTHSPDGRCPLAMTRSAVCVISSTTTP